MRPKWILVAEDNNNDADLTLHALTSERSRADGWVVVARDGSEALDYLYARNGFHRPDGSKPALVLLDLKMPKVDGFEVLHQIKADAELRTIPVVVFSSSSEETDLARCYEEGANAYVVKPLDFKDFVTTLRKVSSFWLGINMPPPE
jgi:CheY-like chemotaxis protein